MICPHCSVVELPADNAACQLCGYQPGRGDVAVLARDEFDEQVQHELSADFRVGRLLRLVGGRRVYVAANQTGPVTITAIPRVPGVTVDGSLNRAIETARDLDHPHIVPVYMAGGTASFRWYTSRYMSARPLAEVIEERGALSLTVTRRIAEQIAAALDHAHRRGVVHGGLDAESVLVDAAEWVHVADFGIGQALAPPKDASQRPGPRADQRALAALLARCLDLPSHQSELPPGVVAAIGRALRPDLHSGFATILDFVAALSGTNRSSRATPPGSALLAARPSRPTPVMFPVAEEVDLPPRRSRWKAWGVASTAVVFLAGGLGWWWSSKTAGSTEPDWASYPPATPPAPIVDTSPAPRVQPQSPRPLTTTSPSQPVSARPAPPRATPVPAAPVVTEPQVPPGRLYLSSTPWGQVYLDGELIGNTPLRGVEISAGAHELRLVRDGFLPLERRIQVAPDQDLRITNLVLTRP